MKSEIIGRFFVLVFVFGLLTGCSGKAFSERDAGSSEQAGQVPVNEQRTGDAPDFTLPRVGGGYFTLSSLKGKVIILDFWATRCPPCRMEIPEFIELYDKYRDAGLEIVGVCLEREAMVRPFAEQAGINYTLVLADQRISQQYGGIRYIPTTFIIDRRGNISEKYIGYTSGKIFEKKIQKLLSEKAE